MRIATERSVHSVQRRETPQSSLYIQIRNRPRIGSVAARTNTFHAINLETPDRAATLTIRSGYYAPKSERTPKPAPPASYLQ